MFRGQEAPFRERRERVTLKTERRKRSGNSGGSREPFHPENEREVVLFHPLSPWYSRIDNLEDEASRILSRGILSSTPFTDSYPSYGEISSFSTNPTDNFTSLRVATDFFLLPSLSTFPSSLFEIFQMHTRNSLRPYSALLGIMKRVLMIR